MLPVVRPQSLIAHIQKFGHELERGLGQVSASGLLLRTMADNTELAAQVLEVSSFFDDEANRNLALMMAYGTYQTLKAQAESDVLESQFSVE